MPQTVPFGFEFESVGEQPTRTLNGGGDGLSPILAQQVNDALSDFAADIADLSSRMDAAETALAAARWRRIASGSITPGDFVIAVPAGFQRLRLALAGDMDATGKVRIQVNGDAGASNHQTQLAAMSPSGSSFRQTPPSTTVATSSWFVAEWGTVESNNVVVEIFPTDGTHNPSYVAHGYRNSQSVDTDIIQVSAGKYVGDVIVSSLTVIDAEANFVAGRYWLDGYLS